MEQKETVFDSMAKARGISVAEMKLIIQKRIIDGLNDLNPVIRKQWEAIPHESDIPTPEEYVHYVVTKLRAERREDLLRKYNKK